MPRYLYGDSEDFPDGYDFLSELQHFVGCASRALVLAHEADELERALGARAQEHVGAVETLQAFFDGLPDLIAERASRSGAPQIVGPYVSQILEEIEAIAAQARAARTKDLDAAQMDVASRIRDCRTRLRGIVAEYLLGDPLPVLSWALSLSLAGTQPQGQVVLSHPSELNTSFTVDLAGDPTWGRVRRMSDVAPGLSLQVGFKKAFLRSALNPDVAPLDELTISALELGPDSMELRLRRKNDTARDHLVISLDPDDTGAFVVKVARFEERGEGSAPFTSPQDEVQRVEQLATALRRDCEGLLKRKKKLIYAQLDTHDVFEHGMVRALFERIAERMAPVASEVARHSPNANELSLKLERDDRHREERYLRKAELQQMVAPLPPEGQALFHQLGFMSDRRQSTRPPTPSAPPPPKHRL